MNVFIYVLLQIKLWDSCFVFSIIVKHICACAVYSVFTIFEFSVVTLIKFKTASNKLKDVEIKAVFKIIPDFYQTVRAVSSGDSFYAPKSFSL